MFCESVNKTIHNKIIRLYLRELRRASRGKDGAVKEILTVSRPSDGMGRALRDTNSMYKEPVARKVMDF